jgi:hypothetical protein
MTETKYWQALRKYLVPRVYVWKINAGFIGGIPDVWASGSLQDMWIENKRIPGNIPAILDLTDHKKYLSKLQQLWLERRYNEGRSVGVIVFSEHGHIFLRGLDWQKPISKLAFSDQSMSYKELAGVVVEALGELPIEYQLG